ncbi:MAG: serine hydrolase domain-containing protein [Bacteroidota bacterium]
MTPSHPYFPLLLLLLFAYPLAASGVVLELNRPVSSSVEVGQVAEYELSAKQQELTVLRVERGSFLAGEEVNLLVTVYGPNGDIVEEVNTANDASIVVFTAPMEGTYRAVVQRWNGAAKGDYSISLEVQATGEATEKVSTLLHYLYTNERPGAAVALIKGKEILFQECIGLASLEYQYPISELTPFDLASLSKMFTAYGIALLIDRGRLSPNSSITDFIPEFPGYGRDITIHQLVHHLSGIKDYTPALALAGYSEDARDLLTKARILETILRHQDTYFPPGTEYRYSNTGYVLLGEIISRVTGTTYEEWMRREVFTPLGMHNSFVYTGSRSIIPGIARSYRKEDGAYDSIAVSSSAYKLQPQNLVASGASGVVSTLQDMTLWAENYASGKLGGESVMNIIRQGIIPEEQAWDWWYGFQRYHYRGQEVYHSEGLTQGYRTVFTHFPDLKATLIYLTNDGEWRSYYVARKIRDLLFAANLSSEKKESASAQIASPPIDGNNEAARASITTEQRKAYVGTYFCSTYDAVLNINSVNDELVINSIGNGHIPLQVQGEDVFSTKQWPYDQLTFVKNEEGKVTALNVRNRRDGDTFTFQRIQN